MGNTLASKYLSAPKHVDHRRNTGTESVEIDDIGNLRPNFIAVGVYFCSATDQLGDFPFGIVDPITDGAGRTWRLVSTELVSWMAGMISKAFEGGDVSDLELGAAILKFYRVRDRLEQEIAAADGCQAGGRQKPGGAGAAAGERLVGGGERLGGAAVAGGGAKEGRLPGDGTEADDQELAA